MKTSIKLIPILIVFTSCITEVTDINDFTVISDSVQIYEYHDIPDGVYRIEMVNELSEQVQITVNEEIHTFMGSGRVGDSILIEDGQIRKWVYNAIE